MGSMWTLRDHRRQPGISVPARSYRGMEMGACSTGIGGPSCEVAIVELMQHGARSIIRVGRGNCSRVEPGDL